MAQNPSATALPSDRPRYRMDMPYVRPPMPHNTPKKYVQNFVDNSVLSRISVVPFTVIIATIAGVMIQEKMPPSSQ